MGKLADAVRGDMELMGITSRLAELFSKAEPTILKLALQTKDYKAIARALKVKASELEDIQQFLTMRGNILAYRFPELKDITPKDIAKSSRRRRFRTGAA